MASFLRNFKKIGAKDRETQQLQENVEQVLEPIIKSDIVDGILVKNCCLLAGKANLITHKLGRESKGYVIVRKRADSRIWDIQDYNVDIRTIAITCSHDVKVDLWIF